MEIYLYHEEFFERNSLERYKTNISHFDHKIYFKNKFAANFISIRGRKSKKTFLPKYV